MSVFCREKKCPTCWNGPAQNFRDENVLSVEIRWACEHGPELAQTIFPGLKASDLFNADVHVIVEEIYALGMTIVRVENLAHLTSVARPIVSWPASIGAGVFFRPGAAGGTSRVVVTTYGAIRLVLDNGTNDNQLQFILLPSRIRNSADPKQD